MLRPLIGWSVMVLAVAGSVPLTARQSANPVPSSPALSYRAVLDRYCLPCHNDKLRTAGLVLSALDVGDPAQNAAVWEKVIRKLRTGAMPPAGMPRPDQLTYDSFASYLEMAIDRAAARPNPGRPAAIHRLNRAEYANAIRDLLALEVEGASLLPPDDSGYGFDNIGDVLSLSPMLLERYLSAARKISRLAVGNRNIDPAFETYSNPKLLLQGDRRSEALPFGSRGGIAVRHHFPLDGEYVIRVSLQRNFLGSIRGLAEPHQLDIRMDGARIKLLPIGGERLAASKPETSLTIPEQGVYERTADAGLEVRFAAKAGTRPVGVSFIHDFVATEDVLRPHQAGFNLLDVGVEAAPAVSSIRIGGPYNAQGAGDTASRRKIFVCRPVPSEPPAGSASGDSHSEEQCARKILSVLARRAYRRPVTAEDVDMLTRIYKAGRRHGDFEAGIEMALRKILVSLEFLFRIESEPGNAAPHAARRISDLELASRLSFFLWSSIPDDPLLDLAEHGQLQNSEVLEQQVRRMLADSRSKALVNNFAGQWLYLRNLQAVLPDGEAFPDFDENLRDAFQRETELFLESMLREDRSMVDLLNADYTYLNERLARHYGIPNVFGNRFRRVTLSKEERRGLLGQGSILTVTSYPSRTSPTLRGKFLLANILGAPPPPPPANVPSLKDNKETKALTMRQRMEQHRSNPACGVCHSRMDPLGFALENYDGIGKWRTVSEANTPIDASGVLPDGTQFQGPAELRKILLSQPDQFVTAVTEKLLTYALGRGVEYYDAPAVRKITREAAPGGYRWSSIIMGIVKSTPFQMRGAKEP